MKTKVPQGKKAFPPFFPCGCRATTLNHQVLVTPEGIRICRHGRKWILNWKEV